jgi:hypothetical protein
MVPASSIARSRSGPLAAVPLSVTTPSLVLTSIVAPSTLLEYAKVEFTFVVIQSSLITPDIVRSAGVAAATGAAPPRPTTSWLSTPLTPRVSRARRPASSFAAALPATPLSVTCWLRVAARLVVRLDGDAVVHGLHASDAQGDLPREFLPDVVLDGTGQRRPAAPDRHPEVIGAQVGTQCVGGGDLALLAGVDHRLRGAAGLRRRGTGEQQQRDARGERGCRGVHGHGDSVVGRGTRA